MTRKIYCLLFVIVGLSITINAQEKVEHVYYKSRNGKVIDNPAKANFERKTTTKDDGTITTEEIDLKSHTILTREIYKDNNAVGIWIVDGIQFNCDSVYNQSISLEIPLMDFKTGSLNGNTVEGFEPAFWGDNKDAWMKLLANNIRFPVYARENAVSGKVIIQFIVNEDGTISQLSIFTSVHPSLDFESLKVISKAGKWNPAKLNGVPIKVQIRMPVIYKIQQ